MTQIGNANYWDADITLSAHAATLHDPKTMLDPHTAAKLDLTIFISCYNESAYIFNTLSAVYDAMKELPFSYEIIVVDDASKDDSAAIVQRFIAEHPQENIILRANKKNKGWAQNYFDVAFLGCGKYFRPICGDNSEPKDTLVTVFRAIGQADIIVPYYISVAGRSKNRELVSKCFTFIVNLITGNHIKYYNGLAIYLRHNILRWHPNTHGFGFQADLLCLMLQKGYSYQQIGLTAAENRREKSNAITFKNILSVVHTLLDITLRRLSKWIYS